MTTLTVKVTDTKDLAVLEEILNRFGMPYSVNQDINFQFSKVEIDSLLQTKADYMAGKTTARDWSEIDEELNSAYN